MKMINNLKLWLAWFFVQSLRHHTGKLRLITFKMSEPIYYNNGTFLSRVYKLNEGIAQIMF